MALFRALTHLLVFLALCYETSGSSIPSSVKSTDKALAVTRTTFVEPKTTAAPQVSRCVANCFLTFYEFGQLYWSSIELSTTYTHTVILVVDEENHTTRTSTKLAAIPPSLYTHHLMPTNSAGTVIATIGDGTTLTYPTNTILYPNGVRASGTYNTSSQCVTLSGTIIWPSSALSSLTQDSPTLPAGETDHYGIMYTVGERGAQYPSGFVRAQQKAGVIPTQCNLASVAPAAAVQGVLVLTSTSISTLQNAKTTEQASSTIANPVVQTATSTSLPTLQDTKTTDQASKTTAKPIKQTTSSTVTPPSQSSSLIPSAVVSPLTTAITTLPMSAESASSISQTTNSLPTPQQSPWPSVDTAVQTKSPTVPQTTITAPDSLLQSSKPSSRASTEITSAQTSPTANTVPAVLDTEYLHSGSSISTTVLSTVAPFASIVMSTSDTTSIIPHSSSILNSTPSDLASPTAMTSTGLDVGAYIMSGLGGLTASTSISSSISISAPLPSPTSISTSGSSSSLTSSTVSSSISFSLSTPTSTSITSPPLTQSSTGAGRRISVRIKSLIVVLAVMMIFGLY